MPDAHPSGNHSRWYASLSVHSPPFDYDVPGLRAPPPPSRRPARAVTASSAAGSSPSKRTIGPSYLPAGRPDDGR